MHVCKGVKKKYFVTIETGASLYLSLERKSIVFGKIKTLYIL